MATLTIRAYRGETDWQAIADLVNACQSVEQLDEEATAYELKLKLNAPHLDKSRDVQLWEEEESGQLIALAVLEIPQSNGALIDGYLWFYIHPTERGKSLERATIQWGTNRLHEVGKERGFPVKLRTYSSDTNSYQRQLLTQHGFIHDRYFLTMSRSLSEPIPTPQLPPGFKLSHITGQRDIQPWVEMFNESFVDHWNHHDLTPETVQYWMNDPNYQPELDLIAIAPDNRFAAFCDCEIKPEEKVRSGTKEGWIELLGTRRDFRKLGLGKAMLLAGLHRLKAAGADTAKLSVDADSLTGATKLYQSVGFQSVETWLSWSLAV